MAVINRRFYTTFIILSVLFFSAQRSHACSRMVPNKHKIHCNFLKKPIQSSRGANYDLLINMDDKDDDETTSKTRHRLHRSSLVLSLKLHPYAQEFFTHAPRAGTHLGKPGAREDYRFPGTPITIAIRCFRI